MKNKKKKFSSLKSVLILLQQLQAKYYGEGVFDIIFYSSGSIEVYAYPNINSPESFSFPSYVGPDKWLEEYRKLLMHLRAN